MSLNAKTASGGGMKIEPMEAGTYPARFVMLVDLGLQNNRPFKGEPKPPTNQVMFGWEFVDEFLVDEDGNEDKEKPRWLSETMTLHNINSERAKSTHRYLALDPDMEKDGDLTELLGTPVSVTVVQNPGAGKNKGRIYNNIAGVAPMRAKDAEKCPVLVNEPRVFDLDDPDMTMFMTLPQWVQDKIKDNLEFDGSALQTLLKDVKEPAPETKDSDDENPY